MSVLYSTIIRQTAALLNQIAGEDVATLAANYAINPLTNTQMKTPYWWVTDIQDGVLTAQADLVHVIANTTNSPFRAKFASQTDNLANRDALPSVDINGKPIVGVFGSIYDATTGDRCDEADIAKIRRIVNSGAYTAGQYNYAAIENGRIYHTRDFVQIDCCQYAHSDETAKVGTAEDVMRLPDVLQGALVAATAWRLCLKQAIYLEEAAVLGQYYAGVVSQISGGAAAVAGFVAPVRQT